MGDVIELAREKKKRRRVGSLAWLWTTLLLLAALVLGFGVAQSSLFNIRQIEVNGVSRLTPEEVVKISGLITGEHIYEANLTKAKNMIAANLWVQGVEIKRRLPATVVINVEERVPAAVITTADGLFVVDASGVLLMRQKLVDGMSVLAVSGIDDISPDVRLGTSWIIPPLPMP